MYKASSQLAEMNLERWWEEKDPSKHQQEGHGHSEPVASPGPTSTSTPVPRTSVLSCLPRTWTRRSLSSLPTTCFMSGRSDLLMMWWTICLKWTQFSCRNFTTTLANIYDIYYDIGQHLRHLLRQGRGSADLRVSAWAAGPCCGGGAKWPSPQCCLHCWGCGQPPESNDSPVDGCGARPGYPGDPGLWGHGDPHVTCQACGEHACAQTCQGLRAKAWSALRDLLMMLMWEARMGLSLFSACNTSL